MFKLLGLLIKAAVFAAVVLVLGNWLHWGDKTISDQVKTRISHAERSDFAGKVRGWADKLSNDAQTGHLRKIRREAASEGSEDRSSPKELIPSSERQKLKALIRELNGSSRN